MFKSKSGCFSVFIILLLVVSLLLNVVFIAVGQFKKGLAETRHGNDNDFSEEYLSGKKDSPDKIAVISVTGVISGETRGDFGDSMVDDLTLQLRQAVHDDHVKAILLLLDSPGGEVNASDLMYHEVSKARAVKPVVVYMGSVAASGAYYTAMGASYLMANDLTITASIGVILQSYNYQDLIGKIGVKALTFKSGKMKDILSPVRPITPEEQAFVQALIDETYEKFVGIVSRERKLDLEMLKKDLADGRILSGKQAREVKLIDELGYYEDAVAKAMELGKVKQAQVIRYAAPFNFERLFQAFTRSPIGALKVQVGPEALSLVPGKFYYISPHVLGGF